MKIFITGGTGFVGTTLTKKLIARGHEVTILTRNMKKASSFVKGTSFLEGNPTKKGSWQEEAPKCEVIINLAGESIFGRWTNPKKKEIQNSRILTTRNLVEALSERKGKETHLFSASAIGYYGFHEDEELHEESPAGDDFLASVAQQWESAAHHASQFGTRVVICRFGIVLGKGGGVLGKMLPAFKRYVGSDLGSGKQWFSWIHEEDLSNIFFFLLENKGIVGAVNCAAPTPVRNRDMTKILAEVLHKPVIMPAVPGFVVRTVMGEFGNIILKGQKVLPQKLLKEGFRFQFPQMKEALEEIISK